MKYANDYSKMSRIHLFIVRKIFSKVFFFYFFLFLIIFLLLHSYSSILVAQEEQPIHVFACNPQYVDFTPDGQYVVICNDCLQKYNNIYFFDIRSGELIRTLRTGSLSEFSISGDGNWLIGGQVYTYENYAVLWNLFTGEFIHQFGPNYSVIDQYGELHVTLSPNAKWILTNLRYENPVLWSTETYKRVHEFEGYGAFITTPGFPNNFQYMDDDGISMAFSPDGKNILLDDNVYDIFTQEYLLRLIDGNIVHDLLFSKDAHLFFMSDRYQNRERITIWDWDSKTCIEVLDDRSNSENIFANHIHVTSDNQFLVAGMTNGQLWFWNIKNGELLTKIDMLKYDDRTFYDDLIVKFSPDGQYVLTKATGVAGTGYGYNAKLYRVEDILQLTSIPDFQLHERNDNQ